MPKPIKAEQGEGQETEQAREAAATCRPTAPRAPPAANQCTPREGLGLAAHEADAGSVPLRVPATAAGGFVGQNFSLVSLLFPPALWWGGGGSSCQCPSSR